MMTRFFMITFLVLSLQGCVGLVIDTAADATIAVAKIPFKVGGAVLDVALGDDEEE